MHTILFLCTGNSCRSIIGEALLNHLGRGRVNAHSAGSHPTGQVNPNAIAVLNQHGIPATGYTSKSWHALEHESIDIVITVCDQAAGETCPAYLADTAKVHWGLPDPAKVTGSDAAIKAAFQTTFDTLKLRIEHLLALPLNKLSEQELVNRLNAW